MSAAEVRGGASNAAGFSQLGGAASRRPRSSLSKGGPKARMSSVHRQSFNGMILSQLLDPILIKLWNLLSSAQSPTNQSQGGRCQIMDQTVQQKDYYKLLICIQVGLFLVDERQIYFTSEQMQALKA